MERDCIFIAGAPRSGTTLLRGLLDGHKELYVFPGEHSTIEQSIWNEHNLENYARNEFITHRNQGQQTLLASNRLFEEKKVELTEEFGKELSDDVDRDSFRAAYLSALGDNEVDLARMLHALAIAVSQSNTFADNAYKRASWLCFKQPFYTELFARDVMHQLPNSKFVHVIRDPVARYTSAKIRRLKRAESTKQRLGPINRLSYVEGHTLIDVASHRLAQQNREQLGAEHYMIVHFESMIRAPEQTIGEILEWLGVEHDNDHSLEATRLGKPVDTRSIISKGQGIDRSASERHDQYEAITAWNERSIHQALLELLTEGKKSASTLSLCRAFLAPLPRASWKCYVQQWVGLARWITNGHEAALSNFLSKARAGQVSISGAT